MNAALLPPMPFLQSLSVPSMPFFRWVVLLLLAVAVAWPAHARRLALVVGNDDYKQFSRLDKAGNDAEAVAKELEAAGFEVSLRRDLTYRKMVVAFEEFYDKVKSGDELIVFYAGHGVQTERGAYLLPVDIEGDTQSQVEKMSYSVNVLFEELDRMKARVSVVIVDACRDNPLRVRGRTIGAARGLSGPDVAKGQMAIFSAGRNQKALDALGPNDKHPNGVFTRELLSRIRVPGQSIEALAIEVRNAVERLASSVKHEQRPLIVNDTVGEFFLYPGQRPAVAAAAPAAPATPLPQDEGSREDRFWDDAKLADNVEGYEAYLATYPNGRYRGLARAQISRLNKPAQTAQNTRGAGADPASASTPAPSAAPAAAPAAVPAAPPATAAVPAPAPATAAPVLSTVAPPVPSATPRSPSLRAVASYALPNGDRYEGEVMGNQRSGRGVYRFANGDRYEGEFADNQFMGQGVMTFANGDRYEGQFQGITKQGRGVLTFASKDRYEGEFLDNLFHGQGTFTFASGERYTGSFQRGLKQGRGEQVFANKDRYVGLFENDKPQGKGTTTHANGDVYEGDHVQGVKQGLGVYRFANGDRYEGSFDAGVFSGRGRLYLANGDRYEGDFRNNVKEGAGVHYFASKDRYEGPFKGGAQHGRGTHFFANGERFVGEFVAGLRHGKGVHHFANGQTREVEYVNGVEKAP